MDFGTIFWPIFSALVAAFFVTQVFDFSIGYFFHRRQLKSRQEFEAKIASGEINPAEMFPMAGGMMPGVQMISGMAASDAEESDKKSEEIPSGQYL